jgi:hypothetical protein
VWGQCRVPDFVWQLATVKDYGPHPIASPRLLKTPHPACFGPETRECIDEHSKTAARISGGLGGTKVVRIGDAASAARLMCSNLCFDTIV